MPQSFLAATDFSQHAHAAARVGGVERLAGKLSVPPRFLKLCITGQKQISGDLFLRVLDVIVEQLPADTLDGKEAREKSKRLRESLAALRQKNRGTLEKAGAIARTSQELLGQLRELRSRKP